MPVMLLFGLTMFAVSIYVFAQAATATARQRTTAITRATRYGESGRVGVDQLRFRERVLAPGVAKLARVALKLNPRMTVETVEGKLLSAGLARKVTPTAFLATKAALALGGLAFGVVVGGTLRGTLAAFPFAVLCTIVGFALPGMVLTMKIRSRKEALRMQLPDALDLLAVSVEAGLGFDGAIAKLTEHLDGPIVEEFTLTLNEMRIGESRHDALKKLAERAAAPEVGHFTRAIIQADVLGISLGRILKVQAADTRERRQAAAEEKAMKAPIKMLFPTVLFIFPAMFLVILGPAMLTIREIF
jgi:tight adherence protein C